MRRISARKKAFSSNKVNIAKFELPKQAKGKGVAAVYATCNNIKVIGAYSSIIIIKSYEEVVQQIIKQKKCSRRDAQQHITYCNPIDKNTNHISVWAVLS